jgi:hypothetical protein
VLALYLKFDMAHLGTYFLLSLFAALSASGCSRLHTHVDSRVVDHNAKSAVDFADASAEPLDADSAGSDGSAGGASNDAQSETPATGDEDGGGVSFPPLTGAVAALLEHCSIVAIGGGDTVSLEVPSELMRRPSSELGAQFGILKEACVAGGFDLARCAGKTAQLISVRTDEVTPWGPDTRYIAHAIALDDFVCCAYRSVSGAALVPGIFPATCGPAYTARAAMQRCNIIPLASGPEQTVKEVSVPFKFADDPLWAERAGICRDGEHELAKCAGKQATLVTVNEDTSGRYDWKKASMLTYENQVCCVWETAGAKPPALLPRNCAAQ